MSSRTTIALEAATFAQVLGFELLALGSSMTTQPQQRDAALKSFRAWHALRLRMAELEPLCPSSAAEGYAQAERLREIAEAAK